MQLTVCQHIPVDELHLYGISDVHIGSPDCDEQLFQRDLSAIAKDPAARVIINGDLLEYTIKSSKGDIYYQKYPPSTQKRLARACRGRCLVRR